MKRIKKGILGFTAAIMLLLTICVPVAAQENLAVSSIDTSTDSRVSIQPNKVNKTYYYKIEDGILYRRLWNHAYQQWETEWERLS